MAVSVARNVPFAGALAVVKRQSELKISEANAGAKLPKCIACPDNNRDQPANEHRRVLGAYFFVLFFRPPITILVFISCQSVLVSPN